MLYFQMRPKEWTNLCENMDGAATQKLVVQCIVLITPYLPVPSEYGTFGRKAVLMANLREEVIVKMKRMVEQIEAEMRSANDCHRRVEGVSLLVRRLISEIRALFGVSFAHFPFVLEFELDAGTDIPALTQRFNEEFSSIIAELRKKCAGQNLPLHLIPGAGSVATAIQVVETEKEKLLREASGWANGDKREHGHLLNRIMKMLVKQISFIYVSHPSILRPSLISNLLEALISTFLTLDSTDEWCP